MSKAFSPGDIVLLKSGGVPMTVQRHLCCLCSKPPSDECASRSKDPCLAVVHCVWHTESGYWQTASIEAELLEPQMTETELNTAAADAVTKYLNRNKKD